MPPRPSIVDRLPELVDAATAVFADKGYKATQMADVAAAMGVAPGSLYNYVEGKEGLFALCLDSVMRDGTLLPDVTLPLATPPLEVTLGAWMSARRRCCGCRRWTPLWRTSGRRPEPGKSWPPWWPSSTT